MLAQTGAATGSGPHSCMTTNERMKTDVDDFWSILGSGNQYTDSDFTADQSALWWADMGETNDKWASTSWARASSMTGTLFGEGISVDDINQGYIGNCWFMAAASAIAEKPDRLESVFLNTDNEMNAEGIYAVNFYALGVPHTVVVDD